MFARGDFKYIIPELLSERPMHGYEVMRRLEGGKRVHRITGEGRHRKEPLAGA